MMSMACELRLEGEKRRGSSISSRVSLFPLTSACIYRLIVALLRHLLLQCRVAWLW